MTYQEYFDNYVGKIISSSIQALKNDDKRKFSWMEMKYFVMWWSTQSEVMRQDVRDLVESGRLELVSGGWTMHDETCTTYEDMIVNMGIGHQFILNEFNQVPRVGWQIDTFGHSATNALFFAEMGFDAVIFARIDSAEKSK